MRTCLRYLNYVVLFKNRLVTICLKFKEFPVPRLDDFYEMFKHIQHIKSEVIFQVLLK